MTERRYIFGPVPSRRLGFSLGVDLVPYKTCSLDCLYCQLGPSDKTTLERREYVPIAEVLAELREVLMEGGRIDWITLSGSGEPTLNLKIGELIPEIKKLTKIPVAVLTNGTLLTYPEVMEALWETDLIVPSLDAGSEKVFRRINRPYPELSLEKLVRGIADFAAGFSGEVWLEVMLAKDINDSGDELEKIARQIKIIRPEKVQLNTVVRPPANAEARALDQDQLRSAQELLQSRLGPIPVEIVAGFSGKRGKVVDKDIRLAILIYLKRRPATLEDLSATLGLHRNEVIKYLGHLLDEGRLKERLSGKEKYFVSSPDNTSESRA